MRFIRNSFCPLLYLLIVFFLPTQFGKHFWPAYSYVFGIRLDYLSPTIYVTDLLILFIFVVTCFSKPSFFQMPVKHGIFLFLFFLSCLTGVVLSVSILPGIYFLIKIAEVIFFAIYTARYIKTRSLLLTTLMCYGAGMIFQSLLAISQFVKQSSLGGILYFFGERTFTSQTPGIANASINGELLLRPYGTLPHPNVLAGYLLIGILLTVPFLWRHSKKKNMFFMLAIGMASLGIFLTLSRVVILLWAFSFVVFFLQYEKNNHISKKILIIIGMFCLGIVILFSKVLFFRYQEITRVSETIFFRETLNVYALQQFLSHPIFGVGLGNFFYHLPSVSVYSRLLLQPVHNIFLLLLAEAGILTTGMVVWFLCKTFARILSTRSIHKLSLLLCFGSFITIGMVDHYFFTLQQGMLLCAFLFGIFWSNSCSKVTAHWG